MFKTDGQRRSFSVTRDSTVIGRREDCDLRIPVGEVSRKHCRLIKQDHAISLEDLDSSNGTFINGQRIAGTVKVEPGDSIQVGPVIFVLQVDGSPADDALAPMTAQAAQELTSDAPTVSPDQVDAVDLTAGEADVPTTDELIDLDPGQPDKESA